MMSSNTLAGFVFATGFWIIAGYALVSEPNKPQGHIWTSASSDQIASRPTLVRAAYPRILAAASSPAS